MAKVSIEVSKGEDDFTITRDGEAFSLREGESIVLLGRDMVLSGDSPIEVMHFIFPADIEDGVVVVVEGGGDEPDEAAHPVAANDEGYTGAAMAA